MRRFKYKRKRRHKYVFLVFIMVLLFNCNFVLNNSYKNIISFIFENTINYKYKNNIFNNINKNVFNNPVNILHANLKSKRSVVLVNNVLYSENNPKIYIYNSHQGEKYSYEYLENSNITPNVMLASSSWCTDSASICADICT